MLFNQRRHLLTKGNFLLVICLHLLCSNSNLVRSQTLYPDGGSSRNAISLIRNNRGYQKPMRVIPYNDGTVMAHVIGSAGMNFLYYFHILGVSCESTDPEFYKIIKADFEFCLNKTGSLPPELKNQPLGSIPKPCVDWKMRRPCYKNLADDYDECLVNRPGLVKKGTDALRFTHAYAKFICGNIADTEAHLLDRYTKRDLVVDGVFQCFPHLQDRIVNCVKRDKVSKTLCSKFYIVHACFGKYYNDDNCQDVQPIYYMDELFRNMSTNLNCPDPWGPEDNYPTTPGSGWTHAPPTPPLPTKGWTHREQTGKENPWPGERGRPWPTTEREPFIRDQQRVPQHRYQLGETVERERGRGMGRDMVIIETTPSGRGLSDSNWNRQQQEEQEPWVDIVERGSIGVGRGAGLSPKNQVYSLPDSTFSSSTRGPTSSYQYVTRVSAGLDSVSGKTRSGYDFPQYSSTPRNGLPSAAYAITRSTPDGDKYYTTSGSSSLASKTSNGDLGYNFFGFD